MGDAAGDRLSDAGSIPARSIKKSELNNEFGFFINWSIRDLNPWPPHCQCGALPAALMPRKDSIAQKKKNKKI